MSRSPSAGRWCVCHRSGRVLRSQANRANKLSPRSLFYFQRKRHKWMQIMSVVPLLFSLGNCVRASTLRAKILLWPLFCHASWSPAQLWPVWIHRFALGGQSWFAGSLQVATREGCWCSAAEAAEDEKTGCLGYLKIQSTLNFSGLLWTAVLSVVSRVSCWNRFELWLVSVFDFTSVKNVSNTAIKIYHR